MPTTLPERVTRRRRPPTSEEAGLSRKARRYFEPERHREQELGRSVRNCYLDKSYMAKKLREKARLTTIFLIDLLASRTS